MSATNDISELFDSKGFLDQRHLSPDAAEVMESCITWLRSVDRSVFLPIDILAVLLSRGHSELVRVVGGQARVERTELVEQLRDLARRVDREHPSPPQLHVDQFSLGFTGILTDALAWARESGRERISEADLGRVMRWRAELQESASVRWALRQLAQPGGEFIFEGDGDLRRAAFSPAMWGHLSEAVLLSATSGLAFLGTPHFLAALVSERGMLVNACEQADIKPARLRADMLAIVGDRTPEQRPFPLSRQTLTPRLVRMLIAAAKRAENDGRRVGERDVLEAFLSDGGSGLELVTALGLVPHLRRALDAVQPGGREDRVSAHGVLSVSPGETPTLDQLGRDLTRDARAGRLSPVLGRDVELQRVINVLMRTEQRNPLLTGEAGVGKTALATALAQRIAEGSVPERLQSMRVIEINGASLVGGTSYRGELEARIQALLEECADNVVLFIDEAHSVFSPRSSSGQPAEIPNHFKSALASGKIAVVAATTESEYRRWMEDDPALRRRFERIHVAELSESLTREILAALVPRFEKDYGVPVTPDALDAAIGLSTRFIPEQSLPDKAKKLLMDATIAVASEIAAARVRGTTLSNGHNTPSKRVVTRLDVAKQVALKTGAPLDRVARGTISWWAGLEQRLATHVVGQQGPVASVARHLVAGRLNGIGRKRPQSVFLFTGPADVGQEAVARAMCEEIFGSNSAFLALEMTDFSEAHSVSRLIGTPPGYVGYQDEDMLVTPLRRKPSRVVLLRNFDKAHRRVQERLARVFQDGEIADTRGLTADASHAIFVLTVDREQRGAAAIGFGPQQGAASAPELAALDPELATVLRGSDVTVIAFDGLNEAELGVQMMQARLDQFRKALREEYDLPLEISVETRAKLMERVRKVTDTQDLEPIFRELVVEPIIQRMLEAPAEEPGSDDKVTVSPTVSPEDEVELDDEALLALASSSSTPGLKPIEPERA